MKTDLRIRLRRHQFVLRLHGRPTFELRFKASGELHCPVGKPPKLTIPLPIHAPPLFLHITPLAHAEGDGTAEAIFKWRPRFTVGAEKVGEAPARPIHMIELGEPEDPDISGDATFDLRLGMGVGLSIAGVVGVHGTVGPHLHAHLEYAFPYACHKAEVSAFAKLTGRLNVLFRYWKLDLAQTESEPVSLWDGGICPPTQDSSFG